MSEKMELKSCPFCRATPHRGPTRMITDQIHGEKIYRYKIWCPHGCATIDRPNEAMTIEDWNTRASSPAQEPVTTEPVAWQNIDRIICALETAGCCRNDYVHAPEDVVAHALRDWLRSLPAPPQPGRDAVIEDVYACCESTLIGFSDELTEQQRKFICDQVSRKVAVAITGEPK